MSRYGPTRRRRHSLFVQQFVGHYPTALLRVRLLALRAPPRSPYEGQCGDEGEGMPAMASRKWENAEVQPAIDQ